ncbi:MAG: hypothetical protein A2046_02735 [Bacteroidetes bacterium GWA2_30_7]|nr:MAG: hypothetical protein A2046_02735 [Bacteroidetes bacterium GWA2_30_7]
MEKYSNEQILDAFKTSESKILNDLYIIYYPMVRKLVKTNKGNDIDAQDLLSDALMAFMINYDINKINLVCPFKTFIFAICSNIWANKIRHRRSHPEELFYIDKYYDESIIDSEIAGITQCSKKYLLYLKHFSKISELCQKILGMFLDQISLEQIAKETGVTEKYVRFRKFRCKKTLVDNIMSDSEFDEIIF